MRFTKMHGLGNDYLFVDGRDGGITAPAELARRVSDRHRGIGSDGLIVVLAAEGEADARMQMFNADGSEAEMCGNGIRCFAKYLIDRGLATANPLQIETLAGDLMLQWNRGDGEGVTDVEVQMGIPILACGEIPALLPGVDPMAHVIGHAIDPALFGLPSTLEPAITLVSMGNPHVVVYGQDIDGIDLATIGPGVEHHPAFPNRINLHLVEVHSPTRLSMRTWERGSGITQACGTGACAVAVAGILGDRHERTVLAALPGGDLEVTWAADDASVRMRGPAEEVFDVEWAG